MSVEVETVGVAEPPVLTTVVEMHGNGYGMPSSHAQFVAFFSVYITLWVFLR